MSGGVEAQGRKETVGARPAFDSANLHRDGEEVRGGLWGGCIATRTEICELSQPHLQPYSWSSPVQLEDG